MNVPEDPDHILDYEEVVEKAEKIVMTMACDADLNVAFIHVIYVNEEPDDLDGIV